MEKWKQINGYEGLFEVSDFGRVRSMDRVVHYKRNHRNVEGHMLKPKYQDGFVVVTLQKGNERKTLKVQNIVAEHFLENPNNYKYLIHKDSVMSNNRADNLEWTDDENRLKVENIPQRQRFIICIKDAQAIHIDYSCITMVDWLVKEGFIAEDQKETAIKEISESLKGDGRCFGFTFAFYNKSLFRDDEIAIKKNGKEIAILPDSRECAVYLLANKYVEDATVETVARTIRKRLKDGQQYHGFIFERCN